MKNIFSLSVVLLILAIFSFAAASCSKQTADQGSAAPSGAEEPSVAPDTASSGIIGNVPLETMGSLSNIKCGDGICHNREYMSTTKILTCRSLLDSCSIDVDGKKVGTENYFICKKDCLAECDMDLDITVCTKSENVYQITPTDRKGNLHNYLMLFRAENVPLLKYGAGKEAFTLDLSTVASALGAVKSIEVIPGVKNSDGTVAECSNHAFVFTDISPC